MLRKEIGSVHFRSFKDTGRHKGLMRTFSILLGIQIGLGISSAGHAQPKESDSIDKIGRETRMVLKTDINIPANALTAKYVYRSPGGRTVECHIIAKAFSPYDRSFQAGEALEFSGSGHLVNQESLGVASKWSSAGLSSPQDLREILCQEQTILPLPTIGTETQYEYGTIKDLKLALQPAEFVPGPTKTFSPPAGTSQVELAQKKGGSTSVRLSGDSAKALYDSLEVPEISGPGFETLTNQFKEQGDVKCSLAHTHSFAKNDGKKERKDYTCTIRIDSQGNCLGNQGANPTRSQDFEGHR
jgi:hypothetical protein